MMKRHFTLVELLVVVGIIAILAGLIIPAVGMAQTSAKKAACLSNQGQVMKIMRSYLNDADAQFLPNYRHSASDKYLWTVALFNAGRIQNDISVARCPSIVGGHGKNVSSNADSSLDEAYGMVYSDVSNLFGFDLRGTKCLRFGTGASAFQVAPNQLALGGCSGYLDEEQVKGTALINFNTTSNTDPIGRPAMMHGDQCNLFFMDGHVESFTRNDLHNKRYYPSAGGSAASPTYEALKIAGSNTVDTKWWLDPDAE